MTESKCDACGHSYQGEPATLYGPASSQGMARRWRICPGCWKRVQELFRVFKAPVAREKPAAAE